MGTKAGKRRPAVLEGGVPAASGAGSHVAMIAGRKSTSSEASTTGGGSLVGAIAGRKSTSSQAAITGGGTGGGDKRLSAKGARRLPDHDGKRGAVAGNNNATAPIHGGRKSVSDVESAGSRMQLECVAAFLGVRVLAADMPVLMQVHAFRCARRSLDAAEKISTRQVAHDIKKEFDKVHGPLWHCIAGSSFGSFVTHAAGRFLYFSIDKMMIMLFKTRDPRATS